MKIIFGLGNPGEKYTNNRHNVGFLMLDEIRRAWDFPEFTFEKKFDSEISEGTINPLLPIQGEGARRADEGKNKILLARPQTFMNNSGEAVRKILDFYKLNPEDIIVIHDDLDIEIGKYKIATDSSSAGHNGVQNIIDTLETQKFKRIRIGIGGPSRVGEPSRAEADRQNRTIPGEDFVLQNFTDEETKKIAAIQPAILEEIKKLL